MFRFSNIRVYFKFHFAKCVFVFLPTGASRVLGFPQVHLDLSLLLRLLLLSLKQGRRKRLDGAFGTLAVVGGAGEPALESLVYFMKASSGILSSSSSWLWREDREEGGESCSSIRTISSRIICSSSGKRRVFASSS